MPAQHLIPSFANAIHVSPRAQANALKALALAGDETPQAEWGPRAAAALILGANWAGETVDTAEVARATHLPEEKVAKQFRAMSEQLKRMAPR